MGIVLAAGAGRRLRPDTDALPKALLPVDGPVTILDIALRNLAAVGLCDVVIVVGYAAPLAELMERSRVRFERSTRVMERPFAYAHAPHSHA